jgi:hypothetical protein
VSRCSKPWALNCAAPISTQPRSLSWLNTILATSPSPQYNWAKRANNHTPPFNRWFHGHDLHLHHGILFQLSPLWIYDNKASFLCPYRDMMLSTFIPPTPWIQKERKSVFNVWIIAFLIPIPPSIHSPTSPTLPINTQATPTSSPMPKPPSRRQAAAAAPCSSKTALLLQIGVEVPGDLPYQMWWFFLAVMRPEVHYNMSKFQVQRRPEATWIFIEPAAAPCSGSNQPTPW